MKEEKEEILQLSCRQCWMAQDVPVNEKVDKVYYTCKFCGTINWEIVNSPKMRRELFMVGCLLRIVIVLAALFFLGGIGMITWLLI